MSGGRIGFKCTPEVHDGEGEHADDDWNEAKSHLGLALRLQPYLVFFAMVIRTAACTRARGAQHNLSSIKDLVGLWGC